MFRFWQESSIMCLCRLSTGSVWVCLRPCYTRWNGFVKRSVAVWIRCASTVCRSKCAEGAAMKVIVMGCGRVGLQVSLMLSNQGHHVTVIDHDANAIARLGADFKGKVIR